MPMATPDNLHSLPEICRTILEQIADTAIVYADPDGAIRGWNAGAAALLGYTPAEIIGLHVSQLYTKADRLAGKPLEALQIAGTRGRFDEEGPRLRKDGHPLAMHTTTYGVRDAANQPIGFALVMRDVTAQREIEQKLHDSERRFQLVVGGLTEYAIFMLDRQGVVTSWNPGAQRIQGHRAEDVVGQHFSLFYDEDDRRNGKPFRALKTAAETGRYEEEGWRLRKDGSQFAAHVLIDAIHDESGEVVAFATITRDITSHHRAARALRESESRFQLLLESITDHAICTLDPSGIITSWNASAERIMGYSAAEIVGEHFSVFYAEPERKEGKPYRTLDVARRAGRFAEEGLRLRKDGTAFAAEVVISPIRSETGQVTGFAKVTRDITERKQREFAEAANEAKTRFLAHLSHELRTPLNAIIGFSEVIKSEVFGEIANKRYVSYGGDIHYSGVHLLNLVNDILDLSRIEAGKLEPVPERVDVNALAEKALRLFDSKAAAKRVRLEFQPGTGVHDFVADERMVYQSCVNLLDNAIKFSKPDTRVGLRVTQDAGWLRIVVADQGYGMPEHEIPIALQPFRQLDSLMTRSTEGAGLGLSLVKSYCEIHGGGIAIRSAVGDGTEVTLRFPYPGGKKHALSVA